MEKGSNPVNDTPWRYYLSQVDRYGSWLHWSSICIKLLLLQK
jgi:hypothetical protein